MDDRLTHKIAKLDEIIASLGRAAVAFSGGVDSAFLLKFAHDRLGDGAIAVTADVPFVTAEEIELTRSFARAEGIEHALLPIDLFMDSAVIANPPDRCYHCKLAIFRAIREFASSKGISHVIEGSNRDDRDDYRPGMRALNELGVRSPLMEAGLTKDEIRTASRDSGLAGWDRPANPCLATRIPHGVAITVTMLDAVCRAERYLRGLGFREVRVRHHGNLARIEAPRDECALFFTGDRAGAIAAHLKTCGFTYITLDIEGYRRGSMNIPAGGEEADGQG